MERIAAGVTQERVHADGVSLDVGAGLVPIFETIRNDPTAFRAITVDPELGTVVWPNGAGIDPDVP